MKLPNMAPVVLQFLPNWETIQRGQIHAGGKLVIEYDMRRMPGLPREHHGAVVGDITAYVKFHPEEQVFKGSVVEKVRAEEPRDGKVIALRPSPYEVTVTANASHVEIWFYGLGWFYETWDSRYGQNYWFPVKA
jgi:Family of unknown function (DUF6209)